MSRSEPSRDNLCRQPLLVDLFDTERYYPVFESLLSHLELAGAIALSQTCRELASVKNAMLSKMSAVDARLGDFFDDPVSFRTQLGLSGSMISGPFALNVLERGDWQNPVMDIFAHEPNGLAGLTYHIQGRENYQRLPLITNSRSSPDIYINYSRPRVSIRVWQSDNPPLLRAIRNAHTTACFNIITWNKIYCVFPRKTLIDHELYHLRLFNDELNTRLMELYQQGWTSRNTKWQDLSPATHRSLKGFRRVADRFSLVIPLDTTGIDAPSRSDFNVEFSQFDIGPGNSPSNGGFASGGHGTQAPINSSSFSTPRGLNNEAQPSSISAVHLKVESEAVTSSALRYGITIASHNWGKHIQTQLIRWTWLELYKLEPRERAFVPQNAVPLQTDISVPSNVSNSLYWDFADDHLDKWFHDWQAEASEQRF